MIEFYIFCCALLGASLSVFCSLNPDPLDFSHTTHLKHHWAQNRIIPTPDAPEPIFLENVPNMTVVAGRDVTLPCVVDNLGNYRVAWMHTDRHTLIALHDRLISRGYSHKYSVTHQGRTWWLHIMNVEEKDSGEYMCQVNTTPMKSQVGYLEVEVPARFDENATSSDIEVKENQDVHLRCSATGTPPPVITWRKENEKEVVLGSRKVPTVQGEWLNITKANRLHMGAYLCIASNGVPPAVSKRMMLSINFAPMIWIPDQLVGAAIGSDVTLHCNLESHPKSVTFWSREGGVMLLSNPKYDINLVDPVLYKVKMRLHIRDLQPEDYGTYKCVAKNALGETEGSIRLYEITKPSPSSNVALQVDGSRVKLENSLHAGKQYSDFYNSEGQRSQHSADHALQHAGGSNSLFDKTSFRVEEVSRGSVSSLPNICLIAVFLALTF